MEVQPLLSEPVWATGVNTVLTNTPNSHRVIVIEPRPEILMACLGQTDYSQFIAAGKLFFIPPVHEVFEQVLAQLDISFLFNQIYFRTDLACKQIGPEYTQWGKYVATRLQNFSIEIRTLREKQEVMVQNELSNYVDAMKHGSLQSLQDKAHGLAAVIIGSAPSFDVIGPQLAEKSGNALYACAMQALPSLMALGIKPDLCLGLDYGPVLGWSIATEERKEFAKDIPLIYSTKMNPDVVRDYPGPKIPMWTQGGIATYVFKGRELVVDAGGNVAVTLTRILALFGVSSITLAGQDFAWSDTKTHAEAHHSNHRLNKNPTPQSQKSTTIELTNRDGETIYTNLSYLSAKRDMEKTISKTDIPFFNLYGGGAIIKGTTEITVEEAHQKGILASAPGTRREFLGALAQAMTPRPRPVFESRSRQWVESLKFATKRIEKLFKKPQRNRGEIQGALHNVMLFTRQDPLYMPYLYNEIMDIGGLIYAQASYGPAEFVRFKQITKRIIRKVKEMDATLSIDAIRNAA